MYEGGGPPWLVSGVALLVGCALAAYVGAQIYLGMHHAGWF